MGLSTVFDANQIGSLLIHEISFGIYRTKINRFIEGTVIRTVIPFAVKRLFNSYIHCSNSDRFIYRVPNQLDLTLKNLKIDEYFLRA